MRPRHTARQAERTQRNAELCGVPLTEWTALTRMERRRLLAAAKDKEGAMPEVETVTFPKVTAQILFDSLVGSMDFGSGMLDTEEVEALRGLAVAIGVDPDKGTPDEFRPKYVHVFEAETDRQQIAWMTGALTQTVAIGPYGRSETVNVIDDARLPDYVPCKVGPYGRKCLKPESDPIHRDGGPDA